MKVDRLLIVALVLGVWALVAVQFFDGVTVEAAAVQLGTTVHGTSSRYPVYVEVVTMP